MLRDMRKLRIVGFTALLAFVLAACGSATTRSTATGSAPPATSAGETLPTSQQSGTPVPAASAQLETPAAVAAATAKLNLNEVTEDQLLSTIPSFSNRMVREFFEYRPYISIQQFRKEIGKYVSAEQVTAYEQYVYVPVDADQADAATLQQLPGVDATIADQLIAGRPYGSNQAFLAKLAGSVSDTELQQAAAFLAAQ